MDYGNENGRVESGDCGFPGDDEAGQEKVNKSWSASVESDSRTYRHGIAHVESNGLDGAGSGNGPDGGAC